MSNPQQEVTAMRHIRLQAPKHLICWLENAQAHAGETVSARVQRRLENVLEDIEQGGGERDKRYQTTTKFVAPTVLLLPVLLVARVERMLERTLAGITVETYLLDTMRTLQQRQRHFMSVPLTIGDGYLAYVESCQKGGYHYSFKRGLRPNGSLLPGKRMTTWDRDEAAARLQELADADMNPTTPGEAAPAGLAARTLPGRLHTLNKAVASLTTEWAEANDLIAALTLRVRALEQAARRG